MYGENFGGKQSEKEFTFITEITATVAEKQIQRNFNTKLAEYLESVRGPERLGCKTWVEKREVSHYPKETIIKGEENWWRVGNYPAVP